MLAIAPELVRLDQAEAGNTRALNELMSELRDGGVSAVSANGVLGDPVGATPEEGRRLLSQLVSLALDTLALHPNALDSSGG